MQCSGLAMWCVWKNLSWSSEAMGKATGVMHQLGACNLVKAPSQFRTLGNTMRLYGIILKVLCRSDLNWASEKIGLLNKGMT